MKNLSKHLSFKRSKIIAKPDGAEWYINDIYYKMGIHGFIFMWVGEWVNSGMTANEISSLLKGKNKNNFSLIKKHKGEVS